LLIGGGPLAENVSAFANRLTDAIYSYATDLRWPRRGFPAMARNSRPWCSMPHLVQTDQLKQLREFFQP
jgi:3-oxoacyl-[acyl-carrier protein] reductase